MKITYKQGDMLQGAEQYKVHCCNAQKKMGSGIAKAIRQKWPEVYRDYMEWHNPDGNKHGLKLGDIIYTHVAAFPNPVICSCIGQEYYGYDGKRYVDYDAIRAIMRELNQSFPNEKIAMPKIGAGLAGGDWDIISAIIEEECTDVEPVVYIYE